MEATILETALSQGIWAALAVFLLISMMKENEKADQRQSEREARYQTLLTELTAKFEILDEMKKDIRLSTTMVERIPKRGAITKIANSAFFINSMEPGTAHSKGSRSTRAYQIFTARLLLSRAPGTGP